MKCYLIVLPSLLFVLVLSLISLSSAVLINEILPNPEEYSDAEWVELFSTEILNLSGWKLDTTGQVYTFGNVSITDYLVVVKNKTSFLLIWPNVSQDKIIEWSGMGLNNGGEPIYLLNQSVIIDTTIYPSFSSKAGKSWARLSNGSFAVCDTPTPSIVNNCSQQNPQEPSITLNYNQEVECNENFSITINAFNFENGIYDVKIDILNEEDENRIGKVWNGTKWLSTNSYVNSVLNVSGGNSTITLTYKVENFEGEAILRPRIRKTGSSNYVQFDDRYIEIRCEQANQPEESLIKIVDAPDSAKFGSNIEIELEIYKGNTTKYAVYVYVEDNKGKKVSDKVTLHFKEKFQDYEETISLTLDCKNEQDIYTIIAEGLNTQDTKEIELKPCESESREGTEGITIGDFTYRLIIPNAIYIKEKFKIKVYITNNDDEDKSFKVWSYVYRASKCYSCEDDNREANAETIKVPKNSFAEAELENIVQEESGAEPGDYKLKIKVLQEDLKTPKEFTYNITLASSSTQTSQGTQSQQPSQTSTSNHSVSSYSTYSQKAESEHFSLTKIMPYILTSVALLAAIYLIITKI